MFIYELIPNLNVEDYETEFKKTIKEGLYEQNGKKNHYEYGWLKEFVALANTNGGRIYIGVENSTRKIVSFNHAEVDRLSLMIHRLAKGKIVPSISYGIKAIEAKASKKEPRYILEITIAKNDFIPVFLKQDGFSVCYVRHFGVTSIATPEQIVRLCYQNTVFSYDSQFSNVKFDIDDFQKLNAYHKKIYGQDVNAKILLSIGFINQEGFLSNGALLFKDDFADESLALVSCCKLSGIDKGDSIFLNNERFASNLLDEFERIMKFIESNNDKGFEKLPVGQKEVISYPTRAVAEAVINALAHRDYLHCNGQIEINAYKDRLEIASPGSIVSGKYLKNERDLKNIIPLRRNNVICSVFTLLKLMEEKGSGFDKIEREYENADYPHRPFVNSDENSVSITLPNLLFEAGVVQLGESPRILVSLPLNGKNDEKILSYCYFKAKTITEIADILHIKPSTYLRNEIRRLTESKLLKAYSSPDNINRYMSNREFVKLGY